VRRHAAFRAVALSLALGLAACAAERATWINPDPAADYDRDRQNCAAQALAFSPETYDPRRGVIVSDPQDALRLGDQCMRARGWRLAAPAGGA
jgi:hypothetical protein